MRIKFLFIIFCIICVISCKFDKSIEEPDINDQINDKYYVNFKNTSSHSVSVYLSNSRTPENFFVEIPANSQQKKELPFLGEETRTFYFVYNLNFGIQDFSFPYYDDKSYKVVSVNKNKINNCKIDENPISKKNLSFIFLKNFTTSDIYLMNENGNRPLFPYNSEVKFVSSEDIGGYVIDDEDNSENLSLPLGDIKIRVGGGDIFADFPSFDYKLGFIYHITCTDEDAKLTSINHLDKTEHELTYKNEVDYHWSICNICGFKTEKETHLFQYKNDDVSHWQECDCGYKTESTEHLFIIQNDEKCHWQECFCGYTGNESEHALSGWEKRDGKDVKSCTECEFEIIAEANTHIIYSVSDLNNMRYNNTPSAIFELACDIDGGELTWIPIDTFYGTLVGNGYSIKNFNINHISALDNHTTYCGFFYKNKGAIKNIFFKNITVNATFEYQTSDWRYVNVGTVAAANYGEINNVHLEDVTINSNLNHKSAESNNDVKFINIVGGIVGKNYESINYCSIRQSSISGSTDSKKNWCDSSTWVGGLCGENTKDCTNLLSIKTKVSATTKGGYNWLVGNDGHLKCYAGCIFGFIKGNGTNSKIVSYNNSKPQISLVDCNKDNDDGYCDNIEKIEKSDYIYGGNEQKEPDAYHSNDLDSISSLIDSWPNWSVTDAGPENYVDN